LNRILVIKLGALGDVVLALGPMAAIRAHHPNARITLLTTAPFRALAEACPSIDEVWIDERPSFADPAGIWRLRRRLISGGFDRVYDLQTSDRSSFYHTLMGPGRRPDWSGIARGASHPHANPDRDRMHTIDRQRDQLAMAGIADVPAPDLSWAESDIERFGLARDFVLLVPGGSAHRPAKRWPVAQYAALATRLAERGLQRVVIGSSAERDLAQAILEAAPGAMDLTGRTQILDLAALGRAARQAIGNDTGPMHLFAVAGTPSTVLFSAASDPAITAPRGKSVTILQRESLADLSVGEVAARLGLG
jgi:ADP-heptose:LPS heptosyltransferase